MKVDDQIESPAPNVANQTCHLKESATRRPVAKGDPVQGNDLIDCRTQVSDGHATMAGKKCQVRLGKGFLQLRQGGKQKDDIAQPREADGQNFHSLWKDQAARLFRHSKT